MRRSSADRRIEGRRQVDQTEGPTRARGLYTRRPPKGVTCMVDGATEAGGAPRLVTGLATSIITRTAGRIPGVAWKLEPCLCPGARGRLDRPVAVDAPGYGAVGASADRAAAGHDMATPAGSDYAVTRVTATAVAVGTTTTHRQL